MLTTLQAPRCCLQNANSNIQLHGFCDASIMAYGCGVCLRTEGPSKITVRLWTPKCRVAPDKKQSLPKLEMCATHLHAQLLNKVKELFGERLKPSYLWSDSLIVLHWLQQHSVTLSTFVGNRVSEIQNLTSAQPRQSSQYFLWWLHCHRTERINMVHRSSVFCMKAYQSGVWQKILSSI